MKTFIKSALIAFALGIAPAMTAVAEPGPLTSVSQKPVASAISGSGHIELTVNAETTMRFYIYSITGRLVKTVDVAQGSVSVDLPQGYYIVKCSEWSKQVVVR